jgi:hypothetical protein
MGLSVLSIDWPMGGAAGRAAQKKFGLVAQLGFGSGSR